MQGLLDGNATVLSLTFRRLGHCHRQLAVVAGGGDVVRICVLRQVEGSAELAVGSLDTVPLATLLVLFLVLSLTFPGDHQDVVVLQLNVDV